MPALTILLLALSTPLQERPAPAGPVLPDAPALPAQVTLDRGWAAELFDADGERLAAGRVDLPTSVSLAECTRLRLERDVELSGPTREGFAVLVLEGGRQVRGVELEGRALEQGSSDDRADGLAAYVLGRILADGRPRRLAVELDALDGRPPGLRGGATLELLPDAGLARPFEARVGPLAAWSWLDPDTPELVVRAELLARDGAPHELALEARLRNAAGLELATELATGIDVGPDRRGVVELRLRPRGLEAWGPRTPGPARLELRVLERGAPVDALTVVAPAHRFERLDDGRVLDRARGRAHPLFVYRPVLRGGAVELGDPARARDLARLAAAGAVAVEALGPFGDPLAEADRDLEARAWEAGLWLAPPAPEPARSAGAASAGGDADERAPDGRAPDGRGGERGSVVELPAVGRADGEAALAEHARAVAELLARGGARLEAFDAEPRGPGLFDGYRRPKFAYHVARAAAGEPTVYPASFWNAGGDGPLDVYSSGDAVELFVDGESVGRRAVGEHGAPPFAARFEGLERGAGELRAVAYADGAVVAERLLGAAAEPVRLLLSPDLVGVPLGLPDVFLVHALAVDEAGHLQAGFEGEVRFTVFGGLEAVGPTAVRAEAGVASLFLRSTTSGAASVAAVGGALRAQPLVLTPQAPR